MPSFPAVFPCRVRGGKPRVYPALQRLLHAHRKMPLPIWRCCLIARTADCIAACPPCCIVHSWHQGSPCCSWVVHAARTIRACWLLLLRCVFSSCVRLPRLPRLLPWLPRNKELLSSYSFRPSSEILGCNRTNTGLMIGFPRSVLVASYIAAI